VVQIKDVPQPVPGDKDILIRIRATSVSSGDARIRRADPFAVRFVFGFFKPRRPILGYTFSGVIAATGASVTSFKPGDEVFGSTDMRMGAHAEYLCLPEKGVVIPKPAQLSHEEAACLPFGAHTAWHFLQLADVKPGFGRCWLSCSANCQDFGRTCYRCLQYRKSRVGALTGR
jgi:NADPH:quinone reductase-like Zn-dependent oxidoreductase